MDACICKMSQIKITSRALFWLDQNYQFSYSNNMFFGVIKYVLQKQPITLWKLVILIQSKKGTRCDFYLGHFTYTSIHLLDSMNGMLGTFFFYQCYFATAVYFWRVHWMDTGLTYYWWIQVLASHKINALITELVDSNYLIIKSFLHGKWQSDEA